MDLSTVNSLNERLDTLIRISNLLDEEYATLWVRNTVAQVNKLLLSSNIHYAKAYSITLAFHNIITYFDKKIKQATKAQRKELAGTCLMSIYFCCIELGLCKVGDVFESTEVFNDLIDAEDWEGIDKETVELRDIQILNYYANCFTEAIEPESHYVIGLTTALSLRGLFPNLF